MEITNNNVNILKLEGKDVINNDYMVTSRKKYRATLDYSLEKIYLGELGVEFIQEGNKEFSDDIVTVSFNYAGEDKNTKEIREELYKNGFTIGFVNADGEIYKEITYKRYKRSSGSARAGKCLFINEKYYDVAIKRSLLGLHIKQGDKVDLASLEAYVALTTSSIIDTINISPKSILFLDEHISKFQDRVMNTYIKEDSVTASSELVTEEETIEINNNIWDGQALLDSSVFQENGYSDKGMLLLRNDFFKGASFNTNIQKFFKVAGITKVEELNGFTLAEKVEDIKLIITDSCVKYLKFSTREEWLNRISSRFGVVKFDKQTHHFGGELVSTHYQLLNTLRLDKDEVKELLEETKEWLNGVLNDTKTMRLKLTSNLDRCSLVDNFFANAVKINDNFKLTKEYSSFRGDVRAKIIKQVREGNILVKGNYSTLFGNGWEMLRATIKDKNNKYYWNGVDSCLGKGEIMCTNFEDGEELLGSRSPHVTMGNLFVGKNTYKEEYKEFFNLSKQIVCVNSIGENILERLSGCDFDSDTLLLTNNKLLLSKAKICYKDFLVPTSSVKAKKVERHYNSKDLTDLDIKTSKNLIGRIINLSQFLNSILWDKINNEGYSVNDKVIKEIYKDCCTLDVLSCIEIDKAKKEFSIDSNKELKKIEKKYKIINEENKQVKPLFFKYIGNVSPSQQKELDKKREYKEFHTTMDYVIEVINSIGVRATKVKKNMKLYDILDESSKKYNINKGNRKQCDVIVNKVVKLENDIAELYAKEDYIEDKKEHNKECYLRKVELEENSIEELSKLKIKTETVKQLIKYISYPPKDKEELYKKCSRKLLSVLFAIAKEQLVELIKDNDTDVREIRQCKSGEEVEISYYSVGFKIV